MKRAIYLLVLWGCVLLAPFIYKQLTHGFRLGKLYKPFPGSQEMEKTEELAALLNQPFSYLDRGMQFFVFASQDEKVVLKLLRKNPRRMNKTIAACRLASSLAQEETGILYTHLSATFGKEPSIRLKNRLGISYSLPLDQYAFVIQRKTQGFKETMLAALQKGAIEPLIDSYLDLIRRRCSKGIRNTDILLAKNFGFSQGKALEIDFGNYTNTFEDPKGEYSCFVHRMRRFLRKHAPETLPLYEAKVAAR